MLKSPTYMKQDYANGSLSDLYKKTISVEEFQTLMTAYKTKEESTLM